MEITEIAKWEIVGNWLEIGKNLENLLFGATILYIYGSNGANFHPLIPPISGVKGALDHFGMRYKLSERHVTSF